MKQELRNALTKNAVQRQLQDQGLTRSEALRVLARMSQDERWERLSATTKAKILLKCVGR